MKRDSKAAAEDAWQDQAEWYDQRHGSRGDDLHRTVVLPAVIRRLAARAGQQVLDIGCGTGLLGRLLAEQDIEVTGVDAAPAMVDAANERATEVERYLVGDARSLPELFQQAQAFDHATAILMLQDLDPIGPVLNGLATVVRPNGRLVVVVTHPAFRVPKQATWGFDDKRHIQYRRIEGYLTPHAVPIRTRPGQAQDQSATTSHHRPLSAYLDAFGQAGWGVIGAEELTSPRRGSHGKRAEAEERAAREIPMFLLIEAQRLP